jgi:hypothetical protein
MVRAVTQHHASYICSVGAVKRSDLRGVHAEVHDGTLRENVALGWWSAASFLFYGWRSLYINWRAVQT